MLKVSAGSDCVIWEDVEACQPDWHDDGDGSVVAAAHHVRKEVDKAVQAFPVLDLEHFISSSHGVEKQECCSGSSSGGSDESAGAERGVKVL